MVKAIKNLSFPIPTIIRQLKLLARYELHNCILQTSFFPISIPSSLSVICEMMVNCCFPARKMKIMDKKSLNFFYS